ncbi:hypothetical protein RB195_007388 [Necator americanus]|uniref:Uncharacterized protein n=1 Tax=Necator americanus TaxID=51031 RepID=A0ABR1BY97_NECAM
MAAAAAVGIHLLLLDLHLIFLSPPPPVGPPGGAVGGRSTSRVQKVSALREIGSNRRPLNSYEGQRKRIGNQRTEEERDTAKKKKKKKKKGKKRVCDPAPQRKKEALHSKGLREGVRKSSSAHWARPLHSPTDGNMDDVRRHRQTSSDDDDDDDDNVDELDKYNP